MRALTILAGGAAFAAAEDKPTEWDGIACAVMTMTTVGYGDVSPETTTVWIIAMAVMLLGIGILATVLGTIAGAVTERFVSRTSRRGAEIAADQDAVIASSSERTASSASDSMPWSAASSIHRRARANATWASVLRTRAAGTTHSLSPWPACRCTRPPDGGRCRDPA